MQKQKLFMMILFFTLLSNAVAAKEKIAHCYSEDTLERITLFSDDADSYQLVRDYYSRSEGKYKLAEDLSVAKTLGNPWVPASQIFEAYRSVEIIAGEYKYLVVKKNGSHGVYPASYYGDHTYGRIDLNCEYM